jgi:3-oxoacyl-[acyl-carrier-protein] synthase II
MKGNKVVVTGLGAVTPLGLDVATSWQGICAGASGAANIEPIRCECLYNPFQCQCEIVLC